MRFWGASLGDSLGDVREEGAPPLCRNAMRRRVARRHGVADIKSTLQTLCCAGMAGMDPVVRTKHKP